MGPFRIRGTYSAHPDTSGLVLRSDSEEGNVLARNASVIPAAVVDLAMAVACGSNTVTHTAAGPLNLKTLGSTPVDNRVGKVGGTFRMAIGEPAAIDPYNSEESEGQLVTKNLFDTLTTVDASGHLQKQLAASYSHDAACTTWTFNVKPGQEFSNGEVVDANAIQRGMTRAALGKAASDMAYHMAEIKGFDTLQSDQATTFAGVSSNGLKLTIGLAAPDCEFDLKTSQPVYSPVTKEAGAADNQAYNEMPIGNGPFMMAKPWQHDKSITIVRNPHYTDGPKALLDKVELTIYDDDPSFEYKGLGHGDFDYARVFADDLKAAAKKYYAASRATDGFMKFASWGVNQLLVNVKNAPMNSVEAREAVSYAIDRDAIITGVLKDSVVKATSLVPPPFAAQGTYQPGVCVSCVKQDPTKAKALALKAGLPPGSKVTLAYSTGGGGEAWIQAIAGQLGEVLGWKVNLSPEQPKVLFTIEASLTASGLFRDNWTADYPTSWNFIAPLLGTQPADNPGDNNSRYSNPDVDKLLADGLAQPDATKRAADYRAAEQIAIGQDLALIPLWYRTEYRAFDASKWVGINHDFFENPTLRTIGLK